MRRTVIVTGGFGILGTAVAEAFAAAGDQVARVDFAPEPSQPVAGTIAIGKTDLSRLKGAQAAVAQVSEALGSPDVLVNAAGGFVWETLDDGEMETWARMFAMNALTCVNMTKAALPELRKGSAASIINVGAYGAISAAVGMGAYAASKSAVHKLTESLAQELRGECVTVNAILPSIIDTPTNRADIPDTDFRDWVRPEGKRSRGPTLRV